MAQNGHKDSEQEIPDKKGNRDIGCYACEISFMRWEVMADKLIKDMLKTVLLEARERGLKVRRREDGGIVIYAGERTITIILGGK